MNTITSLFAQSVEHFADRPALIEPVEGASMAILTYRRLQERVHNFAGYLQKQHVTPGTCILIWSESRANWLIAYLGALLVGVVIVPLDVNSKEDFLIRIAETTEAGWIITTQKQFKGLKQASLSFIDIDDLPQNTLDTAQLPSISPDDLAEIVFTSGTTGNPKGVMLTHNNITSNATTATKVVDIRAEDRALSILPLSHMFELTIEMALLHAGSSIVYARSLVPETLLKLLNSQHVTCMVLVPRALELFLSGIEREVRRQKKEKQSKMLHTISSRLPFAWRRILFQTVHKRFGGHFRFFVSGGAYLPPQLAASWEDMGFRVIQGYGATECAPVIAANPYNDHNFMSVGKPLPDVEVRIAEDQEILVHGPNVAKGYWKNPDITALAFQNGWYHTGDLGYFDKKGNLYLKGRKKNLIVLANGLNVYPEDIENVLQTIPGVKDALVIGQPDKNGSPEVHAVLLLDDASKAKAVTQQANKQLAGHQQIRGFTVWPEADFPRTHTLKVKRQDVVNRLEELRKEVRK